MQLVRFRNRSAEPRTCSVFILVTVARSCPGSGGGLLDKLAQSRYRDVDYIKYSHLGDFSP